MDPRVYEVFIVILAIAAIAQTIRHLLATKVGSKLKAELAEEKKRFTAYRQKTEPLRKYEAIVDAEGEAARIRSDAAAQAAALKAEADRIRESAQQEYQEKIAEAEALASSELKESRAKAKQLRETAEQRLQDAHALANQIESDAREKAVQIAGEAWKAKEDADQYEATVKAMKNIIKGYGDEYLVPNQSVLDELAAEYDHKEAGQELAKIRTLIKSMVKGGQGAECDYVEAYRRETAIEFVLDAFNGKVDTIMAKVKHDNYGKLQQQLQDAFRLVNHNGRAFRNARITPRYFDVMVDQLKMAVAVQELIRIDQEEQRRIKDLIREEERARREFEKALREAEKEEKMLQKAMVEAEEKLAAAAEEERSVLEDQLATLRERLAEAEAREQRAKSMAEQTKQGHVYVISNVGSFGEEVFKIGLTRRLEPKDRVKELGDASVPFEFDVHAMIHSDDAPRLEYDLQKYFERHQVNKVNPRKEFFRLPLGTIRERVTELGHETHWTMKAEAVQYRETVQIERRMAATDAVTAAATTE